jgi:SnoaL-like domain
MPIAVEDDLAIRELYARAIHLFDANDEAWLDCWADDGVFAMDPMPDVGFPGMKLDTREALAGMIAQANMMMQGRGLHHFSNFTFENIEGAVRVKAYLMLVVNAETPMQPATIQQNMRIDDLVVNIDGGWKFKRRTVGPVWK